MTSIEYDDLYTNQEKIKILQQNNVKYIDEVGINCIPILTKWMTE